MPCSPFPLLAHLVPEIKSDDTFRNTIIPPIDPNLIEWHLFCFFPPTQIPVIIGRDNLDVTVVSPMARFDDDRPAGVLWDATFRLDDNFAD